MSVNRGYCLRYGPLTITLWPKRIELLSAEAGLVAAIDWEDLLPLISSLLDMAGPVLREGVATLRAEAEAETDAELKKELLEAADRLERMALRLPLIASLIRQEV